MKAVNIRQPINLLSKELPCQQIQAAMSIASATIAVTTALIILNFFHNLKIFLAFLLILFCKYEILC